MREPRENDPKREQNPNQPPKQDPRREQTPSRDDDKKRRDQER